MAEAQLDATLQQVPELRPMDAKDIDYDIEDYPLQDCDDQDGVILVATFPVGLCVSYA